MYCNKKNRSIHVSFQFVRYALDEITISIQISIKMDSSIKYYRYAKCKITLCHGPTENKEKNSNRKVIAVRILFVAHTTHTLCGEITQVVKHQQLYGLTIDTRHSSVFSSSLLLFYCFCVEQTLFT